MMRSGLSLVVALVIGTTVPTVSIAGPEFLAYEGRNGLHEGQGGEKKTVDGVEFWITGSPPHKFMVLGSLADRRHATGLVGMVRMSSLDDDIAKAAKAAGGDAVILASEDNEVVGVIGSSTASVFGSGGWGGFQASGFSTTYSRPVEKHNSRYIVVRYLPDDTPIPDPPPDLAQPDPLIPPAAITVHP
jgi:hypothetical protein